MKPTPRPSGPPNLIIACANCGFGVADQGLVCPKCGAPTPIAKDRAATRRRIGVVTLVVLVMVAGFFGTYRIVLGVPGLIVRRTSLGFDDPIVSVNVCTKGKGVYVIDTTRLVCKDLDQAGVFSNIVPTGPSRRP